MGCICESKTKDGKVEADVLSLKTVRGQSTLGDDNNKLSINQGTFVSQKKYQNFLKEYDAYENIGKGMIKFIQALSGLLIK